MFLDLKMPNIIYLCPATPKGKCSWEGHAEEVVTHFEDFHKQQYLINNVINFDVAQQHETNYLMNLFGATYLVQSKFMPKNEGDKLLVKLRYLGSAEKASQIRYTLELKIGDMAFTSKHLREEFHPVTIENDGSIEVDLQTIRVMTNKRLTSMLAFIHIENKLLDYAYRSFRRRPNVRHKGGSLRVNSQKKTVHRSNSDIGEYLRSVKKITEEVEVNKVNRIDSDILEETELDNGISSEDGYDVLQDDTFVDFEQKSICVAIGREIVIEILNESIMNALNDVSKRDLKQKDTEATSEENCRKHTSTESVKDILEENFESVRGNGDTSKDFQDDFETESTQTSNKVKDLVEYKSREEILNSNYFNTEKTNAESFTHSIHESLSKSFVHGEHIVSTKVLDISERKTCDSTVSNRSRLSHLESECSEDEHSDDEQFYEENESIFQDEVTAIKTFDVRQSSNEVKTENLNSNDETANTKREVEDKEDVNIYWIKLDKIKCTNCCLYMTPPICTCTNGHSVCSWCKISPCSVCKSDVTDIRNLELEHMSWHITHPCRFAEKGCDEFHTCDKIREHEARCEYFIYVCPKCRIHLKFLDLVKHLKVVHPSLKVTPLVAYPIGRDVEFLMTNDLGVFYCCSSVRSSSIEWSVKFCGVESAPFACAVKIKGKKETKTFPLYRNQDGFNRVMFLNELKAAKVKEKHAVLHITPH